MEKIFKSKKGFTLIELLVVIGILAVLAAIAIPSVAGLIDRANKSADNSNAVEMTNAVERFVSEYELYKQDIASGTFDKTDLDSAQGRVFNVTGIENRSQITEFESKDLFAGKGVDLDSKYPVNEDTLKAVVQNYMKTSSSTFEPKQSDCQYYYSPECGRVIVGVTGSKPAELDAIAFDDASTSTTLDSKTQYDMIRWICLDDERKDNIADIEGTDNGILSIVSNNSNLTGTIPTGATYYDASESITLQAGRNFPTSSDTGDVFIYGDYEYRYNYNYDCGEWELFEDWWYNTIPSNGWGMKYIGEDISKPTNPITSINNENITCATYAFFGMKNIEYAPTLPNTIEVISYAFSGCSKLKQAPIMPTATVEMAHCFFNCAELQSPPDLMVCTNLETTEGAFWKSGITTLPQLPNSVTEASSTFEGCHGIKDASYFIVPTGVVDMYAMFTDCINLKKAPKIPSHVIGIMRTFKNTNIEGTVTIDGNITEYSEAFKNVDMSKITLSGACSSTVKQTIANTGKNSTQVTIQ